MHSERPPHQGAAVNTLQKNKHFQFCPLSAHKCDSNSIKLEVLSLSMFTCAQKFGADACRCPRIQAQEGESIYCKCIPLVGAAGSR